MLTCSTKLTLAAKKAYEHLTNAHGEATLAAKLDAHNEVSI